MDPQAESVKSIFIQAVELAAGEDRQRYLDAACGTDARLRQEVEDLLAHHGEVSRFLEVAPTEARTSRLNTAAADPTAALDFLEPTSDPTALGRLGQYEILEILGVGGFGVVLKARDNKLNRIVAVKALAQTLASSATSRQRFVREAKATAAVNHEHVVGIFGVVDDGPIPYLVMECISGVSLGEKLRRTGPLDLGAILRIGIQIARGLEAAHQQGLVHRDIKPANILLENGVERVKITDFGLARAADDAAITRSGELAGTPQYMSPEQAQGQPLDARSDLFSLGSVLYAMCTGRSPFRAESTVAALRRVCDDTPRPIRDINSEIPDWLVKIIDRLLAKHPDDRLQTAGEVAELLGQGLASLQRSVPIPKVGPVKPALARRANHRRQSLAIAAAALLAMFASLAIAEGTGVTQVASTIIRIFTPEGTLVVETGDPHVKVTVEGDGGLVITGAGLEEIRLRPGTYRVKADKDGQPVPLEQNLVTVDRGGRAIVRVKLEPPPAQTDPLASDGDSAERGSLKVAPPPEQGAFVVLDGQGMEVRKFNTLVGAVQHASDGDTIEIRGNGPFVTPPVRIERCALTIRAGTGFRPVIQLDPDSTPSDKPLLTSNAPLVLEGLVLDRHRREGPDPYGTAVVHIFESKLQAANCRFLASAYATHSPDCGFYNCEFFGDHALANWKFGPRAASRVRFHNSLICTQWGAISSYVDTAPCDVTIQLQRSTLVDNVRAFGLGLLTAGAEHEGKQIRFHSSQSIFAVPTVLSLHLNREEPLAPAEAQPVLLRLSQWGGENNCFATGSTSIDWFSAEELLPPHGPKSLDEWEQFWSTESVGSLEGRVRFEGGALLNRTSDQVRPDHFRLRPDSAGYRAGPDGQDLGANVDLVGPGEAYQRWQKMPEYDQWLRKTRQTKK